MSPRAACLGLVVAGLLTACGYRAGLTLPEGTQTIGVEFFDNSGPLRDVEVELQNELAQSIQRSLDARLVDPRQADLIVRGRVVNYSRRSGIRSPQNQRLETGVRITVEASLLDPTLRLDRDGNPLPPLVLRKARTTTESGFRLAEVDGERAARARAMRNLADRLTLDLFGPVAYEAPEDADSSQELDSSRPLWIQ